MKLRFMRDLHRYRCVCAEPLAGAPSKKCKEEAWSHLMLDAWSVNSVATREKYFLILIQRLGLGMQPLCAWMAWIRAISLAISLRGDTHTKTNIVIIMTTFQHEVRS